MENTDTYQMKDRNVIGVSTLLYAIDSQHNNIYFLLATESQQPRWRDSGKSSDFGGTCHANESCEECGAREFHEETCGVVPWGENEPPGLFRREVGHIIASLKKKQYTFKLTTIIPDNKSYVTYVKQIVFSAGIPKVYVNTIDKLRHAKYVVKKNGIFVPKEGDLDFYCMHPAVIMSEDGSVVGVRREFLEKENLHWVSIPQMRELVKGQHPFGSNIELRDAFRARMEAFLPQFEKVQTVRWGWKIKNNANPIKNPLNIHYNDAAKTREHAARTRDFSSSTEQRRDFAEGKRNWWKRSKKRSFFRPNCKEASGQEQQAIPIPYAKTKFHRIQHRTPEPVMRVEKRGS